MTKPNWLKILLSMDGDDHQSTVTLPWWQVLAAWAVFFAALGALVIWGVWV